MSGNIQVYQTIKDSEDRLAKKKPLKFVKNAPWMPCMIVDPSVRFQTIEGFGGAFTDASADIFYKLSPKVRAKVLKAYFDLSSGSGYTLCRTHINSCDFSLGNYAYDETPGDSKLKNFSIEHDRKQRIPMIKDAIKTAGYPIKLLASPWSPPSWMKTNGEMNHGGQLKPEYRQVWADYYVRFIQEYEKEGLPIWALTIQNEPAAVQRWDSCIYSGEEEKDFVRDYLGPTLNKTGLLKTIKLLIWDHNRDIMFDRAKAAYSDPKAAKYIWGTAFHWYVGDYFENVQLTHDTWPDKHLLFTEGCEEKMADFGKWEVGERYGRSMIEDLNHWTTGWIDWNLLLDKGGGPNHVGNFCLSPIMADTSTDSLIFQSSYYYIGHISRFVRPGAQRIMCGNPVDDLEATAFENPDGSIVIVVMNRTEKAVSMGLNFKNQTTILEHPARSISTYVIEAEK
jgi:glucosylceramidase